jgi:hypothetical protein
MPLWRFDNKTSLGDTKPAPATTNSADQSDNKGAALKKLLKPRFQYRHSSKVTDSEFYMKNLTLAIPDFISFANPDCPKKLYSFFYIYPDIKPRKRKSKPGMYYS